VLTATPVPQGGRRQAVADQVVWLMDRLHEHHQTEDAGLWPLVRRRNPGADRPVDGPADCWRQRDQDDLGSLAAHPQHPVSVLLTEVGDVRARGFKDSQAEQFEHGH
jgi:hypothetical protein